MDSNIHFTPILNLEKFKLLIVLCPLCRGWPSPWRSACSLAFMACCLLASSARMCRYCGSSETTSWKRMTWTGEEMVYWHPSCCCQTVLLHYNFSVSYRSVFHCNKISHLSDHRNSVRYKTYCCFVFFAFSVFLNNKAKRHQELNIPAGWRNIKGIIKVSSK